MWIFGDSFDCYAAIADMDDGYWDSISNVANFSIIAGRFSGSQGLGSTAGNMIKNSGSNDAIHHICVAIQQTAAITGSTLGWFFTFGDGATNQCSVVFRSDGALLLVAGASTGTVLATYTGALTASNTWYQFEIEVRVSNTAGYMIVRKLGNTSADFTSATNLDTSANANDYANRLTIGGAASQQIDDLLWRSDASSVPWVGDIRCQARRPASDASVQWTPSGSAVPVSPFAQASTGTTSTTNARFQPFTPASDGAVGTILVSLAAANAGNVKCSIFASSGTAPTTVLGSATPLSGLSLGNNTFTFGTPVSVTRGTQYWVGFMTDTVVTNGWNTTLLNVGLQQTATSYAAFPTANPTTSAATAVIFTANITPSGAANAPFVADITQDAAASYVYSSTVGQADLYGISAIGSTPATVVAVTTRAYLQKSDAGTRNTSVRLRSGGVNSDSTSAALNTVFNWQYRTDVVDPATGAAWTAVGVANAQIGVIVTA